MNVFIRTAVSSVDLLDKKVVKLFLDNTHEQYKKHLGGLMEGLKGFFTDEPQFCRRGTVFPHEMRESFENEYGEDIFDQLGLLFVKKEGYREFRYRYWKLCQKLFLQSFARPVYDWCVKNGVSFTGHYIEERNLYSQMLFNAGIMPFYEFEHMPGIDWLGRRFMSVVPLRQVGSVAAQLNKKDVLSEMFAMTGWDATPAELKAVAEFQYFFGVNKMCQHLVPYSEEGVRKNDHPVHFTSVNPWVQEDMAAFNDYFNKLGGIIRDSEELVNVAVLHPIRSAYFGFENGNESSTEELDTAFIDLSETLAQKGIGFHYLDETLLEEHGFVDGDEIGCGQKSYKYLILPKCYTMGAKTCELVSKYVGNGGKILLAYEKPRYLEGRLCDYSWLKSNITLAEIEQTLPYRIRTFSRGVFSVCRQYRGEDCLFLLNTDEQKAAECNLEAKGTLYECNILTGEQKFSPSTICLPPLGSKIFVVGGNEQGCAVEEKEEVVLPVGMLHIVKSTENALLLDYAAYSFDGINFSEKQLLAGIFDELLQKRYEGNIVLAFTFEVREVPKSARLLSEYRDAEIELNGQKVVCNESYQDETGINTGDISKILVTGTNRIVVRSYFRQDEKVYYALFGEGVTECLKNSLVYDVYLGNLYILGDFGVYSDCPFLRTCEKNVLFGNEFYIGNKKRVIREMVTDGFPFFAGSIQFKQTLYLDDPYVRLKIPGRIHSGKLYVNDRFAGSLMFDNVFDISQFAVKGENKIEIKVITGCRNFYGPFHDARLGECKIVSPFAFELSGTWLNGQSANERKSYAFVRTGIF